MWWSYYELGPFKRPSATQGSEQGSSCSSGFFKAQKDVKNLDKEKKINIVTPTQYLPTQNLPTHPKPIHTHQTVPTHLKLTQPQKPANPKHNHQSKNHIDMHIPICQARSFVYPTGWCKPFTLRSPMSSWLPLVLQVFPWSKFQKDGICFQLTELINIRLEPKKAQAKECLSSGLT